MDRIVLYGAHAGAAPEQASRGARSFFVPWFLASKKDTKFRNKVRTCDEVATPHFDGVRTTPHSQVSIAPMSR